MLSARLHSRFELLLLLLQEPAAVPQKATQTEIRAAVPSQEGQPTPGMLPSAPSAAQPQSPTSSGLLSIAAMAAAAGGLHACQQTRALNSALMHLCHTL